MKHLFIVTFLFLILSISGCGNKVSSQGTVKFPDGTPLTKGIVFLSNEMVMYQGEIPSDGTFSIGEMKDGDGIPPGTYKVWISGANTWEDVYDEKKEKIIKRIERPVIQPKFTEKDKSGLTFTVEKGKKNRIEIEVENP
jgi:hypothetical protein